MLAAPCAMIGLRSRSTLVNFTRFQVTANLAVILNLRKGMERGGIVGLFWIIPYVLPCTSVLSSDVRFAFFVRQLVLCWL